MPIRSNLAELLKLRGVSLYRLHKETGIAYTTLLRIRDDKTDRIEFGVLEKICRALKCGVEELLLIEDD